MAVSRQLDLEDVERRLRELRELYSQSLRGTFESSQFSAASHLLRIPLVYQENGVLVDLGGGVSPHNGVLAQLGMTVYVVDLLGAYWEHKAVNPTPIDQEIRLLKDCGVRFIESDVAACDLTSHFAESSVDAVTSFHCLEHLHESPRRVLESAVRVLKPCGTLLIEVPNAANARKRLALLLGNSNYPAFNKYYYSSPYVDHVREYTSGDLRLLAKNLGLEKIRIFGKNFIGGSWMEQIPSPIRRVFDVALQVSPGLCSSLFLVASKGES